MNMTIQKVDIQNRAKDHSQRMRYFFTGNASFDVVGMDFIPRIAYHTFEKMSTKWWGSCNKN